MTRARQRSEHEDDGQPDRAAADDDHRVALPTSPRLTACCATARGSVSAARSGSRQIGHGHGRVLADDHELGVAPVPARQAGHLDPLAVFEQRQRDQGLPTSHRRHGSRSVGVDRAGELVPSTTGA